MSCPFCSREVIERQLIHKTENEWVLYNIRAANKGQCLVVPKKHRTSIAELGAKEAASFMETVKAVADVLKKNLEPEGLNFGFNEGEAAGQSITHLHFHILPRWKGDGLPEFHLFHREPKTKRMLSEEELQASVKEFRIKFASH